jgi:hypothetical protein
VHFQARELFVKLSYKPLIFKGKNFQISSFPGGIARLTVAKPPQLGVNLASDGNRA